MNWKKRNSRHIHHPVHFEYLRIFPIIIFMVAVLGVIAIFKANNDLRRIGGRMRTLETIGMRQTVIYHKVGSFDTVASIADKYHVSEDSIIWANDPLPEVLTENMVVTIPPVSGIIHTVKGRETVETIAEYYKTDPEKIWEYPYNEFSDDVAFPITPGQQLIVPDGVKPKNVLGISHTVHSVWDTIIQFFFPFY